MLREVKPGCQAESRHLTDEELIRLRRSAEARAIQAKESGAVTAIRSRALLDTLIYARVTKEDKLRAADSLAKVYQDSQRNRDYPDSRTITG